MMKKWLIIAMAALAAYSCNREVELEPELDITDPEGRVEVAFTVTSEQAPTTKTLGEGAKEDLKNIGVAVFGGSGYLKEYKTYTPVYEGTYNYEYKDQKGETKTKDVFKYSCTISLPLSNSPRTVHLIGNGPVSIPFGRDSEVLPSLLGEAGEGGFWQMVRLDKISAQTAKDENNVEYYIYPEGTTRRREEGEPYVPSESLKAQFKVKNVGLIRNWAKIELSAEDDCNFTPYSFAVVNVPSQGTLVPYGGVKGFIDNYKDLSFDELIGEDYDYSGNLPSSVPFDATVPSEEDFTNYTNGVKQYIANPKVDDEAHTVYLYERPIPDGTIPPTYVILYGLYKNPSDTSLCEDERTNGVLCYYKVDLMSGSKYYPVLRNFRYQINIQKISAKGHATPAEAVAAAGSADVSADVNASHLPDISDGTRRMAIQPFMSKTYIHAQEDSVFVVFYDNMDQKPDPLPNLKDECVTYVLDPPNAGVIKNVEIHEAVGLPEGFNPETDQKPDNYGWRTITYEIASPGEARARTQTLRVQCKTKPNDPVESPLYRDIVISLLPIQHMRVSCGDDPVLKTSGQKVKVDVSIPDGLVESMFPLAFNIEAEKLTLTADNTETQIVMPVLSGPSQTGTGKNAFYFQRTVTWDEYKKIKSELDYEHESRWRTFSSYFKTNCDESATKIYVGNRYFEPGETDFVNYESFKDPKFITSIPYTKNAPVKVSASMMLKRDSYEETVFLELKNLKPSDPNWLPDASGKYAYKPQAQDMVFDLLTTETGGDVSVKLSTDNGVYEPATLVPWHFTNVSFVDAVTMPSRADKSSNVAYGYVNSSSGSKTVLFGFSTDRDKIAPTVKIIPGEEGAGITIPSGYLNGFNVATLHNNTYTGADNYFWAEMTTNQNQQITSKVSFVLSSVGYVEEPVEAGRFNGNIFTWNFTSDKWKTDKLWYEESKTEVTYSSYLGVGFNKISSVDASGVRLEKGDTYEISAEVYKKSGNTHTATECDIYCFIIEYAKDSNNIPSIPKSVEEPMIPEESVYYQYLGSENQYLWTLPRGTKEARLTLKASASRDIVIKRIIGKAFRGSLYHTDGQHD